MLSWLQPVFDLLSQAIDKFGTKFAIAGGAVGILGYAELQAPPEQDFWLHVARIGGIVAVAIAYFVYRRQQESEALTVTTEVKP